MSAPPIHTDAIMSNSHVPQVEHLVAGTPLAGVVLLRHRAHRDARGAFTELFRQSARNPFVPAQWSLVESTAGTLRGMHLHRRHDESLLVVSGRVLVGLHDIRPGSPTRGASALYELRADDHTTIAFSRGLVHGWYFPEPTLHLQAVSEDYAAYALDDNFGCHWSDPALNLPWPSRPTHVAERADAFPPLSTLVAETLARDPAFAYLPFGEEAAPRTPTAAARFNGA